MTRFRDRHALARWPLHTRGIFRRVADGWRSRLMLALLPVLILLNERTKLKQTRYQSVCGSSTAH